MTGWRYLIGRLARATVALAVVAGVGTLLFGVLPDGPSHASLYRRSAIGLIVSRLPGTVSLLAGTVVLWLLAGLSVGVIGARRRGGPLDRAAYGTAFVLSSAPVFWLGLIAIYLFASDIGKAPILPGAGGYVGLTTDPGKWAHALILPWLVLGAWWTSVGLAGVRGELRAAAGAPFVRAARAKGLSRRRVLTRHVLRASAPVVGIRPARDLATLFGGVLLTEVVFRIDGVGLLAYESARRSDFAVVEQIALLAAGVVVVVGLVLDALAVLTGRAPA